MLILNVTPELRQGLTYRMELNHFKLDQMIFELNCQAAN